VNRSVRHERIIACAVAATMQPMFDQFVDWISGSRWSYAAIFAVAVLDAFFPIVPSETAVITGGVVASSGDLSLPLVILVASCGAFIGDNISYWLGAWLGEHTVKRVFRGEKSRKAFVWAESQIEARGFYLIIVARFIPGGRTAVTFSSGYTHGISYRRFVLADAIAAAIWGSYAALLGYIGGRQFEEQPWKGLLAAFVIAISLALLVELVRHKREQRRSAKSTPAPDEA
jgi:membrane-associated protein